MERRPTYEDLKDRVSELEDENLALNEKLDSIMDMVSSEEDEEADGGRVAVYRQGAGCGERARLWRWLWRDGRRRGRDRRLAAHGRRSMVSRSLTSSTSASGSSAAGR